MLHPYALGEREDMIAIHTADTSTGDSWVKGKGTIPMKTLDSFNFTDVSRNIKLWKISDVNGITDRLDVALICARN